MSPLWRRRIQKRHEPRIEFLGEQDGDAEQTLKARLSASLRAFPSLRRAYLARVGFEPSTEVCVALCLATGGRSDEDLVRDVHKDFEALFAKDAFLDILFLSAEQEADIRRVCSAFYERAV